LEDNASLAGPAKFVAAPGRRLPICRCDVPREPTQDTLLPASAGDIDPWSLWARSVTSLASGARGAPGEALDVSSSANLLQQAGWVATAEADQVLVHVQRPGLFRQVHIEQTRDEGARISADLADLQGLCRSRRRAIMRLATAANRRLPLARFVTTRPPHSQVLRCEVHWGVSLVSGAWLIAAIEAVETAIVLTAREMQAAVRDTELARLMVAAPAA
jgi:hypothetical protein